MLSAEKILETYALRWAIEVYFKETKQHFGLLKEQTGDYAVYYASIHLAVVRFIMIAHGMLSNGFGFGRVPEQANKAIGSADVCQVALGAIQGFDIPCFRLFEKCDFDVDT